MITIVLKSSLPAVFLLLLCAPNMDQEWIRPLAFVGEAQAIVGAPLTPVSYAGVARRTTRRTVAATAAVTSTAAAAAAAPHTTTVVVQQAAPPPPAVPYGTVMPALPGGCDAVTVNGQTYSDCGGVFYKAAFQGNNLVYVVVQSPL